MSPGPEFSLDGFTPPQVDPTRFEQGVLKGVRRARAARRARHRAFACLAFTLLGAGILWRTGGQARLPETTLSAELSPEAAWLLARQDPGGAWRAEAWGGHERFSPGVSALATLALLENLPARHNGAVEQAAVHLQSTFNPNAPLHLEGPDLYNHLLGLKALLAVERKFPDPERAGLLRQALHALARQQQPDGGWGYAAESPLGYSVASDTRSNSAVTWWVCELLRDGRFLSVPGTEQALERGETWLHLCFAEPHNPRYHPDSPPANTNGALYWMARTHSGIAGSHAPASPRPDAYRDMIRSRVDPQSLPKPPTPEDRWWRAGGQVYATAASLLAATGK